MLLRRELVVLESEEGRGLLWDLLLRRSLLRFVAVRADLLRRLVLARRGWKLAWRVPRRLSLTPPRNIRDAIRRGERS